MPKGRKSREITSSEWFNREMPCGKIYSGKRDYICKVSTLHAKVCDVCSLIKSHKIKNYEDYAVDDQLLKDHNGRHAQPGVANEPRNIPCVIEKGLGSSI